MFHQVAQHDNPEGSLVVKVRLGKGPWQPFVIDEYGTLLNDNDRGKPKCLDKSCLRATFSKIIPNIDCARFEPRSLQHPEGNQISCLSY